MTRRKRKREKGRVREAGGERGEEVAGPAVPFRGENWGIVGLLCERFHVRVAALIARKKEDLLVSERNSGNSAGDAMRCSAS